MATSSSSGASTVTRVAVAVAAVGAAAYAYHRLTRVSDAVQAKAVEPSAKAEATEVQTKTAEATPEAPAKPPSAVAPSPAPVVADPDDRVAEALARELAEAIELDAKDAQTFGHTSPEETAELQRQAAVQMARLHAAGNMGADPLGGMKTLTPEECGGRTDAYTWTQTENEIVVAFDVPSAVTSKKVAVKIDTKTVRFAVSEPSAAGETERVVLQGDLFRDVVPDECVWEMESVAGGKKRVSVTLHKLRPTMAAHHWRCVVAGEPENDVDRFGPPVVGVNGNDPDALSRIAEEMRARG
jgi:hypothetical protein